MDKIKIEVNVYKSDKVSYTTDYVFTEEVFKSSKGSVVDITLQQIANDIKSHLNNTSPFQQD